MLLSVSDQPISNNWLLWLKNWHAVQIHDPNRKIDWLDWLQCLPWPLPWHHPQPPFKFPPTSSFELWVGNSRHLLHTSYSQQEQAYWILSTPVNSRLELSSGQTPSTPMQLFYIPPSKTKVWIFCPESFLVIEIFLSSRSGSGHDLTDRCHYEFCVFPISNSTSFIQ